jgi:uncharacterized protein YbaP (TraB family)
VRTRRIPRWLRHSAHAAFCFALLSTVLAGSATVSATEAKTGNSAARHPLWVIQGERNSIYLLGSIHVLRQSDYPLPAALEKAYREAEIVYMEIDMDDVDPGEAVAFTLSRGMLPLDRSLDAVLGEKRAAQARAQARALGLDLGMFGRFEPWVVAIAVIQAQVMKLGLDPEIGIEKHFERLARADGKEIRGFETLAEQLGFFDSLSLERQADFLMLSLEDAGSMEEDLETLVSAWRNGAADSLARTLTEEFDGFPDLYELLIAARNRAWAREIEQLLDDADDYLVVVGALHLVGEDSVLEILRRKGARARQL